MKHAIHNAALSIFAVLISLAAVEWYIRMFMPQAIYAINYCDLWWCQVPDVTFIHGGESGEPVTRVRYNSQGL